MLRYTFEWDPIKAKENLRKHGLSFDRAAEIMLDPTAFTIPDEEHSEEEERWVTLGRDRHGRLLILVHTFFDVSPQESKIRIISARRANKRETKQYQEFLA